MGQWLGYGLDNKGITAQFLVEARGFLFSKALRVAVWPSPSHIQGFQGDLSTGVKLTTHLYLLARLRMSGTVRLLPSWHSQGHRCLYLYSCPVIFCQINRCTYTFLCLFAKLQKGAISLSCCLSVCLHGTTRLPLDRFWWNLMFELFSKICRENSSLIKIQE